MASRYAGDISEIKHTLREHGESLTALVSSYAKVAADTTEIHTMLAEAGLNSTGAGRRRLNRMLNEDYEREVVRGFVLRHLNPLKPVGALAWTATCGVIWAVGADAVHTLHLFGQ